MEEPKVVLITGASSGIGKSVARYLAKSGHTVYGTSRSPRADEQGVHMLILDVTRKETVAQAVKKVYEEQGKIDVLINNAGVGMAGSIEETQEDNLKNIYDTNVFGPVRVAQAVLPYMRKQRNGKIINISSIGSVMGLPYRGFYSASKASLDIISETMRMELKPFNIQVAIVRPGDVSTNIGDHRLVNPITNDSDYKPFHDTVHSAMDKDVDKGIDPEVFGKFMDRLIRAKKIKRYYAVGPLLQKVSIIAKRVLPASTFEKLILSFYGLKY